MPWCPSCRQEYRAGIASCADCATPLVADLKAHDAAAKAAAAARVLRVVAPAGTLEGLKASLAQKKIPFRDDTGALLVPLAAADLLEASLAQVAECERVGDVLHVYGPRQDREAELPQEPKWLERPLAELRGEVAAAVPGLFAWLASPVLKRSTLAANRLAELGAAGAFRIEDVMAWAAQENLLKPLFAWAELLAARPPTGLAAAVVGHASARAADGRLAAASSLLHVAAKLKDRAVAPLIMPLLDHAEPVVRDDADEVLVSLSGRDVGFDAEAEPAARARAIALWREWVAQRA